MYLHAALPPELYEVLNCAITSTSFVAWLICLRYLAAQYILARRSGHTFIEAIGYFVRLRLAVGFTVFLTGEWPRMGWVWLARYIGNTHHDPSWMGTVPWVFIPVVASVTSVVGLSCVVRAITPEVWGRWGYAVALMTAAMAVALTQIFR